MARAKILVVEDHRSTAMALKEFLEINGYRVQLADTVASGLAAATAAPFDVILCDLNLPDGTGWDLLEMLQRARPTRAVAFSAYDDPEHIARSRSAGFIDHITKGADPDEVTRRIADAMAVPLKRDPRRRITAGKMRR